MNVLPHTEKNCEEVFRLEHYFEGYTFAEGVFEDRFGKVRQRFIVDIEGFVENSNLTLDETFKFNDGREETRIWEIKPTGNGTYLGEAADVVGYANGKIIGNLLQWQYEMLLPIGTKRIRVHFNDEIWLLGSGQLLNRARVSKFGILLGTVTIVFCKPHSSFMSLPAWQHADTQTAAISRQ